MRGVKGAADGARGYVLLTLLVFMNDIIHASDDVVCQMYGMLFMLFTVDFRALPLTLDTGACICLQYKPLISVSLIFHILFSFLTCIILMRHPRYNDA